MPAKIYFLSLHGIKRKICKHRKNQTQKGLSLVVAGGQKVHLNNLVDAFDLQGFLDSSKLNLNCYVNPAVPATWIYLLVEKKKAKIELQTKIISPSDLIHLMCSA